MYDYFHPKSSETQADERTDMIQNPESKKLDPLRIINENNLLQDLLEEKKPPQDMN